MAEDEKLLRRLRKGDTAALNDVLRKYTAYVFTVVTNRLGRFASPEDVEELASNVFYSLWSHRETLCTDNLRGWLSATARNEACSFLRKHRIETVEAEDRLTVTDDNAQMLLEQEERSKYLQKALDALDPETREIFIRRYYYGQSVIAIAGEMERNYETVKSRLKRGKAKLRAELEKGGYHCEN